MLQWLYACLATPLFAIIILHSHMLEGKVGVGEQVYRACHCRKRCVDIYSKVGGRWAGGHVKQAGVLHILITILIILTKPLNM